MRGLKRNYLFYTDAHWVPAIALQRGERLAESEERVSAETHETDRGGEAWSQNQRGKAWNQMKFVVAAKLFGNSWSMSDLYVNTGVGRLRWKNWENERRWKDWGLVLRAQ